MTKTAARTRLRDAFFAWQCRIRQAAMRERGGRPSEGMCARVLDGSGRELAGSLTVLLAPKEPEESTAFFRQQVLQTPDRRETYERALRYLQADYFQRPAAFDDRLLAVMPTDAPLAEAVLDLGTITLAFTEGAACYRLSCSVRQLKAKDPLRQSAIWHNRLFNPALPDDVHVLAFRPDWPKSAEGFAAGQDFDRS